MGGHILSQNLGPLNRLQRCGGVDRQCGLEVLRNSTQVVIETSKVARHIGFVQCGHPAQAGKGEHSPRCLESETPTSSGVCWRVGTSKGSETSEPPRCLCQGGKAKHPKWSQVPLPFAKWIIVVEAKSTLRAGREVEGHTFEGMS